MAAMEETALSSYMGFLADTTAVSTEISAVANAIAEYQPQILSGDGDEAAIPGPFEGNSFTEHWLRISRTVSFAAAFMLLLHKKAITARCMWPVSITWPMPMERCITASERPAMSGNSKRMSVSVKLWKT